MLETASRRRSALAKRFISRDNFQVILNHCSTLRGADAVHLGESGSKTASLPFLANGRDDGDVMDELMLYWC